MADLNEPKREAVRTNTERHPPEAGTPPLRPPVRPPSAAGSVKPNLPLRSPAILPKTAVEPTHPGSAPPTPLASDAVRPPSKAAGAPLPAPEPHQPLVAALLPTAESDPISDPQNETARIKRPPNSPTNTSGSPAQTRPLNPPRTSAIRTAPVTVAPAPSGGLSESVPPAFCWVLLGVSALTLLIQLWTYFS